MQNPGGVVGITQCLLLCMLSMSLKYFSRDVKGPCTCSNNYPIPGHIELCLAEELLNRSSGAP